jgi:methylmalonyl-CoA mutase, N-terminal domain
VDDSIRMVQTEKLQSLKARRDNPAVIQCLQAIRTAATSGQNLMPFVLDAVEQYCTLGEIADVLREVFGEYR